MIDDPGSEWVFYDGTCGMCHRMVLLVLKHDREGRFRFAPRAGETFQRLVPETLRESLPESIIVRRADGSLLLHSDASLHLFRAIGGGWRTLASALGAIPKPLRNTGYRGVARIRHRLAPKPDGACPVVPAELRGRFAP